METTNSLIVVFLLTALFEVSIGTSIYGLCDFEDEDFCGMSGDGGFHIQHGRPSWDIQAMHSGYAGDGFLRLKTYNSESTIVTSNISHEEGNVEVSFAYYLNGDGKSKSYLNVFVQTFDGTISQIFQETHHHKGWKYVKLVIDVPIGKSFMVIWKAYAFKNKWTQQHDWIGLDFIEVQDSVELEGCFRPPPVQYANPWICSPPHKTSANTGRFSNEKLVDGTVCTTSCLDGFAMQGQPFVTCKEGTWHEKGEVIFMCIDDTAPQFSTCPSDVDLETPFGWGSLWYTIAPPDVSDNTGAFDLELHLDGARQQDNIVTLVLNPGSYDVLYRATDRYNNVNFCSYSLVVNVSDKEAPQVLVCPLSQVIQSDKPITIIWEEPVFSDNSGYIDKVESNYINGTLMAWGDHKVIYTAYDNSSNSASCTFVVTITGLPCSVLNLPVNGALACHDSFAGRFCVSMCGPQGDFTLPSSEFTIPDDYLCSTSGNWYPYEFTYNCQSPYGSDKLMPLNYYFSGSCNETKTQDDIKNQALAIFNGSDADFTMGRNLTKFDFYVHCGLID